MQQYNKQTEKKKWKFHIMYHKLFLSWDQLPGNQWKSFYSQPRYSQNHILL